MPFSTVRTRRLSAEWPTPTTQVALRLAAPMAMHGLYRESPTACPAYARATAARSDRLDEGSPTTRGTCRPDVHTASPTACLLRGWGRASAQNDRFSEATILSTGTPLPAQRTCRRRCRYRAPIQSRMPHAQPFANLEDAVLDGEDGRLQRRVADVDDQVVLRLAAHAHELGDRGGRRVVDQPACFVLFFFGIV